MIETMVIVVMDHAVEVSHFGGFAIPSMVRTLFTGPSPRNSAIKITPKATLDVSCGKKKIVLNTSLPFSFC